MAKKKVDALARFFEVAVRAGSGIGFHRGISVDIVHAALVGQTKIKNSTPSFIHYGAGRLSRWQRVETCDLGK